MKIFTRINPLYMTQDLNPYYIENWRRLAAYDPAIYNAIVGEEVRETEGVELIPSENYTYPEVLAANGSVFTNKYAEGYPGRRYYGGQEFTDVIEQLAIDRAKEVFGCDHANVQPLSGSPMNQAVYLGFLKPGDTVLGMDLSHGGHLTHGHPVSHMGKIYNFVRYKTHPEKEGWIDPEEIMRLAKEHKPKIILCGYTSYPRDLDYKAFTDAAKEVGALTMCDMSHYAGLVAGGVMKNPFDYGFDIVTTTSHKTLRGPRGGMILCKAEHAKTVDKSVFPGLQGGPHMQTIASIAITLKKAQEPEFKEYAAQTLKNSKALAKTLMDNGVKLITNGTDNHMMVMDTVESFDLGGTEAEHALDEIAVTTNKQVIPDDPRPPLRPSGVRLGTPAATTRGMKEAEMEKIGFWMAEALKNHDNPEKLAELKKEVVALCKNFPVHGINS
jgi:glycine hydroxymethyltransferase